MIQGQTFDRQWNPRACAANFPLSWCFPPSQKITLLHCQQLGLSRGKFPFSKSTSAISSPFDPSGAETLKLTSGKRHGRNCCRSLSLPGFPSDQFPDFSQQGGSRRVSLFNSTSQTECSISSTQNSQPTFTKGGFGADNLTKSWNLQPSSVSD